MDLIIGQHKKILPYNLSMRLKKLGYNEGCHLLYTTAHRYHGEDLGLDEEYELRSEGKGDEIEYFPGEWIVDMWNKNDLDYISDDDCSAPIINDVIDWLESEHRVLVVVRPEFENGWRKADEYDNEARYGVVFANKWTVNVYHVGNVIGTVGSNGGEQPVCDCLISSVEMIFYHKSFDSRFKAATYGIELALNHYVKKEDGTCK